MRTTRTIRIVAATAMVALIAAGCSSSDDSSDASATDDTSSTTEATMPAGDTIVDVASSNADFSTLVTAVTEADLAETLQGEGPFTVFAPTNDAFAKIPADQLQAILADKAQLTSILTYHVVPGKVLAADLQPEQMVTTVEGTELDIKVGASGATINGCNIVTTDVMASNGVIHAIDCVLTP
jgi:uncharacterized surface protein with fasciclin (FAS1) repeats